MKSVPSEGTSQNILFIEGIHVDVRKMHDGLSKKFFYRDFNTNLQKHFFC